MKSLALITRLTMALQRYKERNGMSVPPPSGLRTKIFATGKLGCSFKRALFSKMLGRSSADTEPNKQTLFVLIEGDRAPRKYMVAL